MNTFRVTALRTLPIFLLLTTCVAAEPDTLRFCLRTEPRTFDPLLVDDASSETIRYLTGGVLIRYNRSTQKLDPALALSWRVSEGGKRIDFKLRRNVRFSDGSSFGPEDVVATIKRLMDPATGSPVADNFHSGSGPVQIQQTGPDSVSVRFPVVIAELPALFDEVAISRRDKQKDGPVLGPFLVGERRPGVSISLRKNAFYWAKDDHGKSLPYLDQILLSIQQNREAEALSFERREIDLIQNVDPEILDRLTHGSSASDHKAHDAGPALDAELLWFNQAANAPLPAPMKKWFTNVHFRRAISAAIRRDDLCRILYKGHAVPALGPVSPSNRIWVNSKLAPRNASPDYAQKELAAAGFRKDGANLVDSEHHRVEFSLITNSGNKIHERMLAMIQQDLSRLGIRINITTLDFSSLIERMTRTFAYEAVLMNLVNTNTDPNGQMSVWLSSGANHQWNPGQKSPATTWEAEIDRLMQAQATALDSRERKKYFDRVQEIAREQEPFLYLVHPNALSVISKRVINAAPSPLRPQMFWNIERLSLKPPGTLLSMQTP